MSITTFNERMSVINFLYPIRRYTELPWTDVFTTVESLKRANKILLTIKEVLSAIKSGILYEEEYKEFVINRYFGMNMFYYATEASEEHFDNYISNLRRKMLKMLMDEVEYEQTSNISRENSLFTLKEVGMYNYNENLSTIPKLNFTLINIEYNLEKPNPFLFYVNYKEFRNMEVNQKMQFIEFVFDSNKELRTIVHSSTNRRPKEIQWAVLNIMLRNCSFTYKEQEAFVLLLDKYIQNINIKLNSLGGVTNV